MKESTRILINAMVVHPNYGSEFGFPWFWIINLARYNFQIDVITCVHEDNQAVIEELLVQKRIENVTFHFIPFPPIWKIKLPFSPKYGTPIPYFHEMIKCWHWHYLSYQLGKQLIPAKQIQIVHQLNTVGFRMPGFHFFHKIPIVWGPIGAGGRLHLKLLSHLNLRGRLFYIFHNSINFLQWNFAPYINWCFYRADAIICSTKEMQRMTKRKLILSSNKISYIPETGAVQNDLAKSPKTSSKSVLTIATACYFMARKNLPLLFDALKSLESDEYVLNICGEGPAEDYFKTYADQCGVKNINWLGWLSKTETNKVIAAADIFVMPSLKEANSTVLFESFANATPVIMLHVNGLKDTIKDGINGYTIKPRWSRGKMVTALASHLSNMMKSHELRHKLSKGALETAHHHLYSKRIERLLPIYRQVLGEK
ncbi:MAG: glycosyltransferase [Bacteroidota bacterium]